MKNVTDGGSSKDRITSIQRFDAITGVAFILRIACSDEPSSATYAEKLLKDAVKKFPSRLKNAIEFFPDIDFSDAAAAAEAENL